MGNSSSVTGVWCARALSAATLFSAVMMAAPAVAQAESSFYQETRSRHQQESRPAPAPRADARAQAERVDRARLERSQLNRAARHDASRRGAAPGPGRRAYLRQTFKAERRALDLNSRINRR